MRKRSILWTRLAALPLTLLLVVCGGASAKANDKPAFSQSGTQGVSMTWTIENLYFVELLYTCYILKINHKYPNWI